jgi:signal peptidase II
MKKAQRLAIASILLLVTAGCDQATKRIAQAELAASPPVSYLNGFLTLFYTLNPGGILSLGSQLPAGIRFAIFVVFTAAILAAIVVFLIGDRQISLLQLVALSLIAGGGVGNLIDRIFHSGAVIDFLRLKIGIVQTGIFNLADVAIFGGVFLFLITSLRAKHDPLMPS